MQTKFWKQSIGRMGLAAAILAAGTWAKGQDATPPAAAQDPVEIVVQVEGQSPVAKATRFLRYTQAEQAEASKPSEYWIGVALSTLDEFALAQLGLQQGVAAEKVYDDSPAAKAGVQKHDVLLKFGDSKIIAPEDLIGAVERAKEIETELSVLRSGKEVTLKVTPIKRAKAQEFQAELPKGSDEAKRVEAWFHALRQGAPGSDPVQFLLMRPGMVLHDHLKALEFPKDLSIMVEKQGNEPAKIKVKKGDKSWETTSDKLGELTGEVRPYVEHLLGGGSSFAGAGQGFRLRLGDGGAAHALMLPPPAALSPQPVPPVAPPVLTPKHLAPQVYTPLSTPQYGSPQVVREYRPDSQGLEAVHKQLQDLIKKVEAMQAQVKAKAETPLEQMKREMSDLRKQLDELRKKSEASGK